MSAFDEHVPLTSLWAHRSGKASLSSKELHHLYDCPHCMDAFGLCQISKRIDEVRARQKAHEDELDEKRSKHAHKKKSAGR